MKGIIFLDGFLCFCFALLASGSTFGFEFDVFHYFETYWIKFLKLKLILDMEIPADEDTKPKVTRNSPPPIPEYTSGTLFAKHIFALQVKRFHHSKRNKKGVFCEVSIS